MHGGALVRFYEQANGNSYSEHGTRILFPHGVAPQLVWFGQLVRIDRPERFGPWDTQADQRAYVRAFNAESMYDPTTARSRTDD